MTFAMHSLVFGDNRLSNYCTQSIDCTSQHNLIRDTSFIHDISIMDAVKKERIRKALISLAKAKFESSSGEGVVAPISPTPASAIDIMLPKLNLTPDSRVLELGCGDGRWTLSIAKKFSCNCIGIDIDNDRVEFARLRAKNEGLSDKVDLRNTDIFQYLQHLHAEDFHLMVVYLFRDAMIRISRILKRQGLVDMPSFSSTAVDRGLIQIVCVGFTLPGFAIIWQTQVNGVKIYLYHTMKLS